MKLKGWLAAIALMSTGAAMAQHQDVEVGVEDGALVIENGLQMLNGGVLFEAEFGELGEPFGTDDPGFEVDDGLFQAGEILAFQAIGTLQMWDGNAWTSADISPIQIAAMDVLGNETLWDGAGTVNPMGFIDGADDEGGIHSHVEFEIQDSLGGTPMPGAFMIELALFGMAADQTTQVYDASQSMFVAFNLGLDESVFEMAVDAALVPIPGAAIFMLSGLLSMFGISRRKTA
ncbi:MAG: hypothetical protein AB8G17_18690 [Gammaproteobacteria bacterium]